MINIRLKEKADGWCGVCGKPVPKDNFNLFYCNSLCCGKAYNYFHRDPEPNWGECPYNHVEEEEPFY